MSRIFLSHSSKNNDAAVALRDWLLAQGWDDVFLDLDPQRGIVAGDRWERALNQAALRCEAVIFLVSRAWLASDWCLKEFHLAHRLNKRLFGLLIDDIPVAELPAMLTGTWQLVSLVTGRDHVMLRGVLPGSHDQVHVTFSQEGLTRLRIGLERAGLDARFFAWPPANDPGRPPYRGLLPLEAADAGIFFGREAPTVAALDRIRGMKDGAAPRLLVVLGASGAGKSSFLRAGLLPRLVRDDRNYIALPVIRPERAAINGETGLLRALEAAFTTHGMAVPRAEIRSAIESGAASLRPLLQSLLTRARSAIVSDGADAKVPALVLAIDQGEELFLAEGASESAALLTLLRELLTDDAPAVLVIVTIRSDAYEPLQTAKPLEGVAQQPLSLIPMPRGAYQAVIEGPAARLMETDRALVIEPALSQALLADIEDGGGRDALPLLAFTLERLYLEYGARGRLTVKDYDALGRIKGSIEAAVERALAAADADARIPRDREARLALLRRGLIPWLAGIDPDTGSPRRQKARMSEIPDEARPLINLLVEQRLLSTDLAEDTRERTIEPAHEALLRQWGSLQGWLHEDFAALTTLETAKRAAREWAANANGNDWLAHRAGRLEDAERLLRRTDLAANLGPTELAYLASCRRREDDERKEKTAALERELVLQRRASATARRFGIAAAIVAIITAATGLYAYTQKTRATAATEIAKANLEQSRQNLRQAKSNESRFLSRESTLALARGEPVTAMGLALEALPQSTKDDDRPYLADAERSLYAGLLELRELHILAGDDKIAVFSPNGARFLTASEGSTGRILDTVTGKQLVELKGHEKDITSAAFSLDGLRIVSASSDNTVRVWDVATGREVARLSERAGIVALNSDGSRVATAAFRTGNLRSRTARIWDVATGQQIAVLEGHKNFLTSVVFSPNGARVVTAAFNEASAIWDAVSGQRIAQSPGSTRSHGQPVFSPDGRLIAIPSGPTTLIWDALFGREIVALGNDLFVNSAAFSPDSTRVVTAAREGRARVWDATSGRRIADLEGHGDAVTRATYSHDGRRIVTASDDKTARIWDAQNGQQIAVLRGHDEVLADAVFQINDTRVVTTSRDKTVRVWDAAESQLVSILEGHQGALIAAAYSTDDARIVTVSKDHTARVWNAATKQLIATLRERDESVNSAAFSVDGARIVTSSDDKVARIWEAATGRQIAMLNGHEGAVSSAAFSVDGARIVTSSDDKTARIWDAATGKQIAALKGHAEPAFSAAFSPDGTHVVTTAKDGTARLWDVQSGSQIAMLKINDEEVFDSAAFSPDGAHIVTASSNGAAQVWDVPTGRQITELKGHQDRVATAEFSPDGRRIVTAGYDATARVWDAATGLQIALMDANEWHGRFPEDKAFAARINSARFSPDGTRIVTASVDKTARVWNAKTGEQVAVLRGHAAEVSSATFSSDGALVLTGSADTSARVWIVPKTLDNLIEMSRDRIPRCLTSQQRSEYFLSPGIPSWCFQMSKWPLTPRDAGTR